MYGEAHVLLPVNKSYLEHNSKMEIYSIVFFQLAK